MKSRNIIFWMLLCLSPLLSEAQVKVEVGDPYGVIDAKSKSYIRRGKDFLTVKVNPKGVHIQKLDVKTLSLITNNSYDDMPSGFELENIMIFNNRCYFFYSYWVRAEKLEQLYFREIDFEKGTFIGTEKLLISETSKIDGELTAEGFYNFSVKDKFDFFTSYDSSKMVIQYRMKPEEKRDAKNFDLIGLRVFGRNMEPIWGDLIQMPYTEKQMDNIDYSVDSYGNAFILCTVFDDNTTDIKKERDGDANYHIELLKVIAFKKTIESKVIAVNENFISTIWLYEGPNDLMYCAGFYNKGKSLSNADGIFMFKLDKQHAIYDIKYFEIPLEILNQFENARTKRRNEKNEDKDNAEFASLKLREFIIEDNGSIILVGEQHFITQRTVHTSSGSRTTYYYHYNDILVTKIDPSGKLAWMKKIPKVQLATSSAYMPKYKGGMSYSLISGANAYYILFLDNAKNAALTEDKEAVLHRDGMGGILTSYKIENSTGKTTRTAVFDVRDIQGMSLHQFSQDRLIQTNSGEFVLEAYKKGKEDILIKVNLE